MEDSGRFSEPALLILTSLAAGPKHGYAMILDVEQVAGVQLGPGTLYGALARLEEQGLIAALPKEGRRRPYQITGKGQTALQAELARLRHVTQVGLRRLAELGGVA